MRRGWSFLALLLMMAGSLPVLAQTPTAEQIGQWIDDLSHDSYAVRRDAGERLLHGGYAAPFIHAPSRRQLSHWPNGAATRMVK